MSFTDLVKNFDFYKSIQTDIREKTSAGGAVSIAAAVIMSMLFLCETYSYVQGVPVHSITIDDHDNVSPTAGAFWVNFDLTFPAVTCDHISVDVEDKLGSRIFDIQKNVEKIPLDAEGVEKSILPDEIHLKAPDDHVSIKELQEVISNADIFSRNNDTAYLEADEFQDWVDSHEWSLVNFRVEWCPWCQMLVPVWKSAAAILAKRTVEVPLATVECTKHMELCKKAGVTAFPTIKLYHRGKHVPPDYKGKRTVNDIVHFAETASEQKQKSEEVGLNATDTHRTDVGCTVVGHLFVHKVPGRIQFSLKSDQHTFNRDHLNFTHQVHHLSFNDIPDSEEEMEAIMLDHEIQDKVSKWLSQTFTSHTKHTMHEHYLKVVEYEYKNRGLGWANANRIYEHSISSHSYATDNHLPAVKFHYDLSPLQVTVEHKSRPWFSFITMVCALIGGAWSIMSVVNDVATSTGIGKTMFADAKTLRARS
uniref:Thioredoxin domain-containing protein n=1 Tax=Norrisiella sphaerica TaxID=552664 RepID=A0A7S2VUP4_9EUKA|mmetsp:Transcript_1402/g.1923  ORF Transcript_1402/g.1923 Transcript_1402/m.1923 type:complete len:477 (+) Transcript_1402:392-1822(+)|eukprot:CAMPEP_0184500846 /NCGR_PEP_ID=MMETSP0113_2-20130426/45973_1 /TAXON_ID=91329 /ORGANISM="Norrisiella sphaerica, Strain BC52" /LENGTH=476 /DNA_ID=CAMNT_0026889387 /DNA_START=408 /DNA_END=1838 /DNA_ORIENTATION=-